MGFINQENTGYDYTAGVGFQSEKTKKQYK
jgi:hypothetical protein